MERVFFASAEELRSTLRYLSEKMKTADHILIETFGEIIADIGCLMIDLTQNEKWLKDKRELEKQIGWYIYQTEWFTHDVKRIRANNSFDSLVEAAAKIGIKAVQVGMDQTAKDAIKIISNFANKMLSLQEDDSYGFTEPRIMERACYIGIVALKLGKNEIVEDLKKYITPFEDAYRKKWFLDVPEEMELSSPSKNQLMMEVHGLTEKMRSRYGLSPILNRADEKLLQIINKNDVDNFIMEVWGVKIETENRSGMFF